MTTVKVALDPRTFQVLPPYRYSGWGLGHGCATHARGPAKADAAVSDSPLPVSEVPTSLPTRGVVLRGKGMILRPLALNIMPAQKGVFQRTGFITERRAIARQPCGKTGGPVKALLASFTQTGSIPPPGAKGSWPTVENAPAWVVTFTPPRANPSGVPPENFRQIVCVLNAVNGDLILGTGTK